MMAAITAALDDAGIRHMVTGSSASAFHGEPRTTADIDIVIDPTLESLTTFVESLDPDQFYVGDAFVALSARGLFNVIQRATGWKVDLIVIKDRPFSRSEFERRMPVEIEGVRVSMTTAEDTILAKLEWARSSGSQRQRQDVRSIFAVSGAILDRRYLLYWAGELGLSEDLAEAELS